MLNGEESINMAVVKRLYLEEGTKGKFAVFADDLQLTEYGDRINAISVYEDIMEEVKQGKQHIHVYDITSRIDREMKHAAMMLLPLETRKELHNKYN